MHLSIISKDYDKKKKEFLDWQVETLYQAAKKKNIKVTIEELNYTDLKKSISKLGDIILWRSSFLEKTWQKNTFYHLIEKEKLFNTALMDRPFAAYKYFQQKVIGHNTDINTIDTFFFKSKEDLLNFLKKSKRLKYPIIAKPNFGSTGNGVIKINNQKEVQSLEIDFMRYIFQNYIENNGDYRILVLDGKALGVIKRVGQEGSWINNFSKGGSIKEVKDKKLKNQLSKMAVTIGWELGFKFCGVDIIEDKNDRKLYFMENNSSPQWEGFYKATKINVAEKIIESCIKKYEENLEKSK